MSALKAYQVTDDYEGYSAIVFAEQSVVARRLGAAELDIEFSQVESCRRMPEFDQYADIGHVPTAAKLAAGWWFECHHCSRRVDEDGYVLDVEDEEPVLPYLDGDDVYCDFDCYAAERTARIMRRLREQALCDMINERFHGATATCFNEYEFDRRAWFKFPGGSGTVEWRANQPEHVWVIRDDLPAWEAFTGKKAEIPS